MQNREDRVDSSRGAKFVFAPVCIAFCDWFLPALAEKRDQDRRSPKATCNTFQTARPSKNARKKIRRTNSNRCGAHARSHVTPLPLLRAPQLRRARGAPRTHPAWNNNGQHRLVGARRQHGTGAAQSDAQRRADASPAVFVSDCSRCARRRCCATCAKLASTWTQRPRATTAARQSAPQRRRATRTSSSRSALPGPTSRSPTSMDARFTAGLKDTKTKSRDHGLPLSRSKLRQPQAALAPDLLHSRCCSWS